MIDTPVPRPTAVEFGGEDLSTLYISTASVEYLLLRSSVAISPCTLYRLVCLALDQAGR